MTGRRAKPSIYCSERTNYFRIFSYSADDFALTRARGRVLNIVMGRAIKRQFLSPVGWTAVIMASLAAVAIAWTAAYLCVQLMSG